MNEPGSLMGIVDAVYKYAVAQELVRIRQAMEGRASGRRECLPTGSDSVPPHYADPPAVPDPWLARRRAALARAPESRCQVGGLAGALWTCLVLGIALVVAVIVDASL